MFDKSNPSLFKWPKYYNGQPLFYEWSRDYVKEFRLNKPNGSRLADIRQVPLTPGYSWQDPDNDPDNPVDNPMDMEFGPDGALYILEYGDGYFSENPDAKLTQVQLRAREQLAGGPRPGRGPAEPERPARGAAAADGEVHQQGDESTATATGSPTRGTSTATARSTRATRGPSFTYDGERPVRRHAEGDRPDRAHVVRLRADHRRQHDAEGHAHDVAGAGRAVPFGQTVTYTVTVEDDTPVDCTKVKVSYVLGHDQHGHPLSASTAAPARS